MVNFVTNFIFGLFPEIVYFTLFLIYTKGYKNNRIKLFILLLLGYTTLKMFLPKNIYFQIGFTLYVPLILKLIYKDRFHISDMFVFIYSSIILILCTCATIPIYLIFGQYMLAFVLNRILIFIVLFILKDKLNKAYKWIISQWNRNYENPNKVKAITIRQVSVISMNIMIYVLYLFIQLY